MGNKDKKKKVGAGRRMKGECLSSRGKDINFSS